MWSIGSFAFVEPLILLALAGLPVLWWLLRQTPPAPQRLRFPAIRLLLDLHSQGGDAAPHALVAGAVPHDRGGGPDLCPGPSADQSAAEFCRQRPAAAGRGQWLGRRAPLAGAPGRHEGMDRAGRASGPAGADPGHRRGRRRPADRRSPTRWPAARPAGSRRACRPSPGPPTAPRRPERWPACRTAPATMSSGWPMACPPAKNDAAAAFADRLQQLGSVTVLRNAPEDLALLLLPPPVEPGGIRVAGGAARGRPGPQDRHSRHRPRRQADRPRGDDHRRRRDPGQASHAPAGGDAQPHRAAGYRRPELGRRRHPAGRRLAPAADRPGRPGGGQRQPAAAGRSLLSRARAGALCRAASRQYRNAGAVASWRSSCWPMWARSPSPICRS